MLLARNQVVWFVQHAIQLKARLPCKAEDFCRGGIKLVTCKQRTSHNKIIYTLWTNFSETLGLGDVAVKSLTKQALHIS